jgi:hypothetical protein
MLTKGYLRHSITFYFVRLLPLLANDVQVKKCVGETL